MTTTTQEDPTGEGNELTGLPRPRAEAYWRWATPRRALVTGGSLVAGGAMAAGLGLGVAAAATPASASTSSSSSASSSHEPPGGTHAPPGKGGTRPTVGGKITALHGDDIVVQSRDETSTTVVYSSGTTFTAISGPKGARTSSSSAALKVGAFIGVQGTKNDDGSVTASSVTIGGPPPDATGGPATGGQPEVGGRPGQLGHPPRRAPSA